jgi:chemotaxis regulatin CheY-phosphate phosphatase CheZ
MNSLRYCLSNNNTGMDDYDDETMDTVSGYSDTEKYQNYMQIINALKHIETGQRITEDWMEDNKWLIEKWRDWIDDYSTINSDMQSRDFRKLCSETETIMQYLIRSIRSTKTFDVKVYTLLLRHMKKICDTIFSDKEMEDLMEMLSM